MKREELVHRVSSILADSFLSVEDDELRNHALAEKIVRTVIEPIVREREKALIYLFNSDPGPIDN
jgi:hypothetical protein